MAQTAATASNAAQDADIEAQDQNLRDAGSSATPRKSKSGRSGAPGTQARDDSAIAFDSQKKCIVDAAQNINYLDPVSFDQLNSDLQTVMVVAGLLIGGTYQGLYAGYPTDPPAASTATTSPPASPPPPSSASPYNAKLAAFCTLNHVAFGLAVLAVFLAITGVILLQKLRRWPDESDKVPDAPEAISAQYVEADTFAKVEKYVKALNFVWNAHNYGILRPKLRRAIQWAFLLAWASLLLSLTLTLAAAALALHNQLQARKAAFAGVVGGIGGLGFLISIVPPVWAMTQRKDNVYLVPQAPIASPYGQTPAEDATLAAQSAQLQSTRSTKQPLLRHLWSRFCSWPKAGAQTSTRSDESSAIGVKELLKVNWWSNSIMKHVVVRFKLRSSADFQKQVWYDAVGLAKEVDPEVKIISRKAAELQAKLEEDHSTKIAPIMDKLSAWKEQYGWNYAVHVFQQPSLLPEALQYTRTLWTFWKELDRGVENKDFTLEDFFSTRSYGAVWLGRAKEYRMLAEQLDIVNWYYKNKHVEYGSHYLTDDFVAKTAAADGAEEILQEYYPNPAFDARGNLLVHPERKHLGDDAYGGYEEWLVKGSRCRPDRFRLIQEWEARQCLYDKKTGKYEPDDLNQAARPPKSTLLLAWQLRKHLGTTIRFGDEAKWPLELKKFVGEETRQGTSAGAAQGAAAAAESRAGTAAGALEEVVAQLDSLRQAMLGLNDKLQQLQEAHPAPTSQLQEAQSAPTSQLQEPQPAPTSQLQPAPTGQAQ